MKCISRGLMSVGGLLMCVGLALAEEPPLLVDIDAKDVVCRGFIGFGVEWDSRGYPRAGITKEDFDIIRTRVEWMRLPAARIMMQCKWCYTGNGKYDWETTEMKALYRHLDVCQKLGTTVFLTDWGCEPGWLRCPDVAKVDDPKYAEIIGTYMDYLLKKKGYSCIKNFIMVNEPNYEVKNWGRWKTGVQNVHSQFRKRKLADKVLLTGSDHEHDDKWHRKAVDQLQDVLGSYDIHRYTRENELRSGDLYKYFLNSWQYALRKDPKAKAKPLIVGEAGLWMKGTSTSKNPLHGDYRYGVIMADYAVQAANAGSWSVLAWMLDDNSHPDFTWGMWTNKKAGLTLKPWFYTWSLLSRYFPPGSRILRTKLDSRNVRVLASNCVTDRSSVKQSWTFCVVNRANAPKTLRLRVLNGPRLEMNRYVYSRTSTKTDKNGFPVALDGRAYDLGAGAGVRCEAESVTVLTSLK